jgi:predicted chitinase
MSEDWLRVFKNVSPKGDMGWMASAAKQIEDIAMKFGIDDVNSMSHLIGHMAEETMGFTKFEESMYYSAERLHVVWPSRFSMGAGWATQARMMDGSIGARDPSSTPVKANLRG